MKKAVIVLSAVLALSGVAAPSYATGSHHQKHVKVVEIKTSIHSFLDALLKKLAKHKTSKPNKPGKPTPSHQVPEIDTGSAALVLALMGGVAAVRHERRRKDEA